MTKDFKAGDKVMVRKDSRFSNQRQYGIGIITNEAPHGFRFSVTYDHDLKFNYDSEDLEKVKREITNWQEEMGE